MFEAGSKAWQARAVCIAVVAELLRGGRVVARVFLHSKPKIETSERFEKVWIGNMNAAAAAAVVPTWCFQVLLNTVMANISNEVTSSICCTAAKLERYLR